MSLAILAAATNQILGRMSTLYNNQSLVAFSNKFQFFRIFSPVTAISAMPLAMQLPTIINSNHRAMATTSVVTLMTTTTPPDRYQCTLPSRTIFLPFVPDTFVFPLAKPGVYTSLPALSNACKQ